MNLVMTEHRYSQIAGRGLEIGCLLTGVGVLLEGYLGYAGFRPGVIIGLLLNISGCAFIIAGMMARVLFEKKRIPGTQEPVERLFSYRTDRIFLLVFSILFLVLAIMAWDSGFQLSRGLLTLVTSGILLEDGRKAYVH